MSEQLSHTPELLSLEQSEAYIRGLAAVVSENDIHNGDVRIVLPSYKGFLSKDRVWDHRSRDPKTQDIEFKIYSPLAADCDYQYESEQDKQNTIRPNYTVWVQNKPRNHPYGTTYKRSIAIETFGGYGFSRRQEADNLAPVAESYRPATKDEDPDYLPDLAPPGEDSEMLYRHIITEIKDIVDRSLASQPETLAAIEQKIESQKKRPLFAKLLGRLGTSSTNS